MNHTSLVCRFRGTVAAGLFLTSSLLGSATPLRMDYTVNSSGGGYVYNFTLTLDNHDNSWSAGQGWDWLIFGDCQGGPSGIADFSTTGGTSPIGPFCGLTSSVGYHNGPTLAPVFGTPWIPSAVGDMLSWTGTSSGFLDAGQMKFSSLVGVGGASPVYFEQASRSLVQSAAQDVPDGGSTAILLGLCFSGFVLAGKRAKRES